MKSTGAKASSGWKALTAGTKLSKAMKTKYTLAKRWNCSKRFLGKKDTAVYLVVFSLLLAGCLEVSTSGQGDNRFEATIRTFLTSFFFLLFFFLSLSCFCSWEDESPTASLLSIIAFPPKHTHSKDGKSVLESSPAASSTWRKSPSFPSVTLCDHLRELSHALTVPREVKEAGGFPTSALTNFARIGKISFSRLLAFFGFFFQLQDERVRLTSQLSPLPLPSTSEASEWLARCLAGGNRTKSLLFSHVISHQPTNRFPLHHQEEGWGFTLKWRKAAAAAACWTKLPSPRGRRRGEKEAGWKGFRNCLEAKKGGSRGLGRWKDEQEAAFFFLK